MLRLIPVVLLLFVHTVVTAQTNCEDVKKENEYLKKALQITTPAKTITSSKIDFNLLKVEGNTKEQTVEIILTLVNHDANTKFEYRGVTALDVEGNEYKTNDCWVGSEKYGNKIYTDTPVKSVIKLSKVLPGVKILKLLALSYYGEAGRSIEIEFKDLTISWK